MYQSAVPTIPIISQENIFAFDHQRIVYATAADVTGDGLLDALYLS